MEIGKVRDTKHIGVVDYSNRSGSAQTQPALDTLHCTPLKLGDSGFGNKIHCKEKVKGRNYKSFIDLQLIFSSLWGFVDFPACLEIGLRFFCWIVSFVLTRSEQLCAPESGKVLYSSSTECDIQFLHKVWCCI